MEEVLISSVSEGAGSGEDAQTENVTLNFAKVKVEYTPQAADGSPGGTITAGFNIRANVVM
jgi:type VI secretion system secreted protein Hcp